MFLPRLRRKEAPWEVVDNKFVDPSPTYYGDESVPHSLFATTVSTDSRPLELEIDSVSHSDMRGTYVFDMKIRHSGIQELQKAVRFSRQQLLREAAKRGYNILLVERYAWLHAP